MNMGVGLDYVRSRDNLPGYGDIFGLFTQS
jgi:hypothetical protein